MRSRRSMTRRRFLKASGAAAAGCWAPTIIPASALGADGHVAPSNRINVGMIGMGRIVICMNLKPFLKAPDCR
jgi:hypothetical protein